MIQVGMLAKIWRMHVSDGLSIHEVVRSTGQPRKPVRDWLRRAQVTEPKYPKRDRPTKFDGNKDTLSGWLKTDAHRGKRDRRTAKATFLDFSGAGLRLERVAFARVGDDQYAKVILNPVPAPGPARPRMRKSHSRERDDIGANRRMNSTILSVMIAIRRLRDRDSGTSAPRHRPEKRGGAAHGASQRSACPVRPAPQSRCARLALHIR